MLFYSVPYDPTQFHTVSSVPWSPKQGLLSNCAPQFSGIFQTPKRFVEPLNFTVTKSDHPLAMFNLSNVHESLRHKKGSWAAKMQMFAEKKIYIYREPP